MRITHLTSNPDKSINGIMNSRQKAKTKFINPSLLMECRNFDHHLRKFHSKKVTMSWNYFFAIVARRIIVGHIKEISNAKYVINAKGEGTLCI
jgi:hypothetical protein